MTTLKFACLLTGEQYQYVRNQQPSSQRKIMLYANCMLLPIILWFINGYLLIQNVIAGNFFAAILTAFIAAFIIFLIERAIVMSNGSKPIFWFRIVLGFIVASLGSISFDEVIFKHDIDNQVAYYKQAEVDTAVQKVERDYQNQIALQQSIVAKKYGDWQNRLDDVNSEMKGGPKSSGYRGKGEIAKENIRMAALLQSDYNTENNKLSLLESNVDAARAHAKTKAEADFNGNALLIRIRAMFDLIAKDKFMLSVYILFTLLLFAIEFIVVLIKVFSKESFDEKLERMRNEFNEVKAKQIIATSIQLLNATPSHPTIISTKNIMNTNPQRILN